MKTREEQRMMLAGMAMQGLCANASAQIPASSYAESAVDLADALLAELDRTAPKPETPSPDADGWIEHRPGDPMPCDAFDRVRLMLRDGSPCGPYSAGGCRWDFKPQRPDWEIIAWKPA